MITLLIGVTACKNNSAGSASDDPNLGLWIATTGEMLGISIDVTDMFGKGFTIELKANGKCTLNVDGKKANGKWTLTDGAFTAKGGGVECIGRLENSVLTLDDVMGMGLTLIFYKEGRKPAAASDTAKANDLTEASPNTAKADDLTAASPKAAKADNETTPLPSGSGELNNNLESADDPENTGAGNLTKELAWWDGEWYGYWSVISARGDYEDLEGGVWDCYAVVKAGQDGKGIVYVWDDEMELGTAEISISTIPGTGSMGAATAEGGVMFDIPLEYAAWIIMPEWDEYENRMVIEGSHDINADDYYKWSAIEYRIVLRPWGIQWDDIPENERPPHYDDWYISDGFYKYPHMLEALAKTTIDDESAFIHSAFGE